MLTASPLEEVEPRLRALLGLVDSSEQTRRVIDYVIAYAANIGRGAIQLKERPQAAIRFPKRVDPRLKRTLAVIDSSRSASRVLDYVIGYAASVGPVEAIILKVHVNPTASPSFAHRVVQKRCVGVQPMRTSKGASHRLNRLGIVHKLRAESGEPALTIIKCAKEELCDMIVLHDSNPGVAAGKLPREMGDSAGSVSQRVAHLADVPVVIAK